ncbi:MAG: recombinase family protein, partial [Clostridiales bacterium]|nr:recombinase family protein [Clostridiales bacterium]
MRVAAYARVSTKKKEQLDSLENQTRFFEEYAKSRGYTLVAVYSDEKSGRSIQKREGFQQLLADGEKKLFDVVLFRDATRLARNTVDSLQSFRKLIECGITLHFINIGFTATRENEFQLTLLSAVSQGEGDAISSRARFGYVQSAKQGRVPT